MGTTFEKEMIGIFLDEVEEQLQTMDQDILELEQVGESESTIQSLFRATHTLKGSSATVGFEEMKRLTHEMEHILDQVRMGSLPVTDLMINLLFKSLDTLRILKEEYTSGESISIEIEPLINELQQFAAKPEKPSLEQKQIRSVSSSTFTGINTLAIVQEAQEQGMKVFDIHVWIASISPMKAARALIIHNQLSTMGEVLDVYPSPEDLEEETGSSEEIHFLFSTQTEDADLKRILISIMDVENVEISPFLINNAVEMKLDAAAELNTMQPTHKQSNKEGIRKTQTVRVDVERLEQLMNLVGELVINQTRISQVKNQLHSRYASDVSVGELGQISDDLSQVVGELQESVMKARMLPIEHLFNRFPRMVRDLAQSLGKEIDLIIEGQGTELDRTVIEEISDPIIHLIRNAIDHGIETSTKRNEKGKSVKGQLRITAAHDDNQVAITVGDDGAGIDPQKIKESALRKGIISDDEAKNLTDQEAINLIFYPGFSTTSSVSDVSGRGVGMDIVRNHIEKLSGSIDIETELGKGTTFKIKLPLTLAIITGLLIELNGRTFIVPMSNVVEIIRMPLESIQTINGESIIIIREQVLPVVWLHDAFKIPRGQQTKKQLPIIVAGTSEKRIALVVDELHGNQEIVVKSLGSYVGKIGGISGATILGDGRVALILEMTGICEM